MVLIGVILGVLPLLATRWRLGAQVTPDGEMYLEMGRGYSVPRPYSLRLIAKVIGNYEVFTWSSIALFLALTFSWVSALHDQHTALIVCAMWGALPASRRLAVWTTLVDAPSQASIMACGVLYMANPYLGMAMAVLACLVHERAQLWAPLVLWMTGATVPEVAITAMLSIGITQIRTQLADPHPLESEIAWLRQPFKEATGAHRQVLHEWRIWVLPWGVALGWIMEPTLPMLIAGAIAYGSLAVSMDKVRTIQAFPVIWCLGSALVVPSEYIWLAILLTSFIPDRTV